MAARPWLRVLLACAADVLLPPVSLLSHARVGRLGTIEADLWRTLDFLAGPVCQHCGMPMPEATNREVVCPACLGQPPVFDAAHAALAYDDVSKPLILAMKHGARKDGVAAYATWMLALGPEQGPEQQSWDVVLAVPLHWTRLWRRGHNQAGWLAQAIARRAQLPFQPRWLVRHRRTPSQHRLSAKGRRRNVSGAFRAHAAVRGLRVLLVDDVYTTGATMNACATALKQAGATWVQCVALARVVRPTSIEFATEDDLATGGQWIKSD